MLNDQLYENFVFLVRTLITTDIAKGVNLEYEKINSYIHRTEEIVKITLTSEDYDKIFHEIEKYFSVKHTRGCAIFDDYDEVRNWYKNGINDSYFWDRYRMYLKEHSTLDANSIQLLDEETLPNIMNCLGNPLEEFDGKRLRRGLVIGDVQSGKTATYSGLICKAVDAGYKVVILLAGVTESLRQQTQERIDEGIVGMTSWYDSITKQQLCKRVGVGLDQQGLKATSYTTQSSDFVGKKDNISSSLISHSSVVLFVIKKNVSVLTKLYNWLKNYNYDKVLGYIDVPLLLIDDEADNASLNTNKDETNPTKTNSRIRKICNLFKNATYVGFTATPFANVFINPESVDEMKRADLFPEHFIYVLPTPNTYIGPKQIFYTEGEYHSNIKYITDIEEPDYSSDEFKDTNQNSIDVLNSGRFYYRHTKEWDGILPDSLTDSIYCFFLANIIRDLRGDGLKPRSMLVNMSRFIKVQHVIKEHIETIYKTFYNCVITDFKGDLSDEKLPLYQKLKTLWNKHYSFVKGMDATRVLQKENILNAVKDIKIFEINGSNNSNKLDYKNNKSLRVIAIGGIALSRGLTLEGLLTSYFYRNTATFDVLMQMGRWFGYRQDYGDIFQIWTSMASARWYEEISKASEELKDDLRGMFEQKLTPKDFGIKVRDDCEELQITAFNKMRLHFKLDEYISFYGNIHETPYVSLNVAQNKNNLEQLQVLVTQLHKECFPFLNTNSGDAKIVKDVPKSIISNFIGKIACSKMNPSFNAEHIKDFIDDKNTKGVDIWDIVFLGGKSELNYEMDGLNDVKCAKRAIHVEHNAIVMSSRRKLLSANAGSWGLSDQQIEKAKKACQEIWSKYGDNIDKTIPSKAYFEHLPDRKPVLVVLLVVPEPAEEGVDEGKKLTLFRQELGNSKIATFAMGFPGIKGGKKTKRYMVNSTYYQQYYEEEYKVEEEDDE